MITLNFSRQEFACRDDCGLADPHPLLVIGLQRARDILRVPLIITGPCRCPARNAREGGAEDSFHLPHEELDDYCAAADPWARGVALRRFYEIASSLEAFGRGGIGVYVEQLLWDGSEAPARPPRLHLDVRHAGGDHEPARWAFIDGEEASLEDALAEDEKRRSNHGRASARG